MRIRTIKPDAFKDEGLWFAEQESGLPLFRAFTGLWCVADREGRFEWRPLMLRAEVLPYWEGDFEAVLGALVEGHFITRYEVCGRVYGEVRNFKKHQLVNHREQKSSLPAPPTNRDFVSPDFPSPGHARAHPGMPGHARGEGKGKEGKGREDARARARGLTAPSGSPSPESSFSWLTVISLWDDKSGRMESLSAHSHRPAAIGIAKRCKAMDDEDPFEACSAVLDSWLSDDWVRTNKPHLGHLDKNFGKYASRDPNKDRVYLKHLEAVEAARKRFIEAEDSGDTEGAQKAQAEMHAERERAHARWVQVAPKEG